MTSAANSIALGLGTGVAVRETASMSANGAERTNLSAAITGAMNSLGSALGKGAALQLESMFGGDERSWRRRLTGASVPDGETSFSLLLSPFGPKMILAATEHLSPADYETFWNEMFDALAHARLRRRQSKGPF